MSMYPYYYIMVHKKALSSIFRHINDRKVRNATMLGVSRKTDHMFWNLVSEVERDSL